MALRQASSLAVVLIIGGVCAGPPIRAAGVVHTCDEAALLDALAGGGTVTFGCSGTITLTAPVTISINTAIDGTGQNVTISGGRAVEIFTVPPGVRLELKEMTIAKGHTALFGGAIFNQGRVDVSYSTFSGNTATFLGGAIFNVGTLTVTSSTFSGNSAPNSGGGAILNDGIAIVADSTFSGNSSNSGGAIDNSSGTLTVVNSAFYRNEASDIGGGILNDDTTKITNSTFSSNRAFSGGGIDNNSHKLTLLNSIVANSAGGNCSGLRFGGAGNLSSDESCPGIQNQNPLLGPLQYNGGPTDSIALLAGSPAIDAAIEAYCPATDQRRVPRPQGPRCDIGAYERASVPSSGNTCITFYNDTFNDNVNVSDGQNCGFVSGGVTGNITMSGGNLTLSRALAATNVQITGGGTFRIAPFTTIRGDLQIQNIPAGGARNLICGLTVEGNLQFQNNGTAVEIGLPSSSCPGNTIEGDLQVHNNTATTDLFDNIVSGNLQDNNNTALTQVIGNVAGNDLQCQNNSSIIGGPNTAKQIQGQCF